MRDPQPTPFGPASAPSPPVVGAPRPGGPKVFGVLSIVFAALTLVFSLASGCMSMLGKTSGQYNQFLGHGTANPAATAAAYERFYRRSHPATAAHTLIYSVMSIALFFVGLGQLRYRPWARRASVIWGLAALASLGAAAAVSLLVIRPATRELFAALAAGTAPGSLEATMNTLAASVSTSPWMVLVSVLFYAPYPIMLLVYFRRPGVRAAMAE